jgi:argininosuccinate lyase
MAKATAEGFMEATDLADYLVTKGMPFREAHEVIGRIVLHCIREATTLPALPLAAYQSFSALFGADVYQVLSPEQIVARRDNPGATAPRRVRAALRQARQRLEPRKRIRKN